MDDTDFFPIEKLVEFGLGVAVASQMSHSMNQSLQAMRVPGVDNALCSHVSNSANRQIETAAYYAALDGVSTGPLALAEVARLAKAGRVVKETYIWKPGMKDWELAENVPEILALIALTPPPVPKADPSNEGREIEAV